MTRKKKSLPLMSPVVFPVPKAKETKEKSFVIKVKLKVRLTGTLASLLLRPVTTVRLVKKFQKGLLTAPKWMRQPSVLLGRQLPIPKYQMSVSPMRVQMRLRLPYIIS